MFDMFGWLRRKAAEAVVGGVTDGLRLVAPESEPVPNLDDLRKQLAESFGPKSLPPASEEVEETAPKKGRSR